MREDVVVVGDGPAGAAAAAACAEAGLGVTAVSPSPGRPWRATYGAWADELPAGWGAGAVAHRWPRPRVLLDDRAPVALDRPYAVLDNDVLQTTLRQRAGAAGARELRGVVRGVTHQAAGSVVHLADGSIETGLVIDASGHRPALTAPGAGRAPAWQVAFGIVARLDPSPLPPGGMWFMDWRAAPLAGIGDAGAVPSFCYALDLGDGRALVEETSLAARPAVPAADLHGRLLRRLDACGARVVEVLGVERVRFPMGVPLPALGQRVVGYGAAAGMVHPATGYHVAAALREAPALARAVAQALGDREATPATAARAAWRAVWPDDRVRQRALHLIGLEALLGLDSADTQVFFAAFFGLPAAMWSAYVSGACSGRHLAAIMLEVVRRLPARLAWRVARPAIGRDGLHLLRAALAPGDAA